MSDSDPLAGTAGVWGALGLVSLIWGNGSPVMEPAVESIRSERRSATAAAPIPRAADLTRQHESVLSVVDCKQ